MPKNFAKLARRPLIRPVVRALFRPIYLYAFERDYQTVLYKRLLQELIEYLKLSETEVLGMFKIGQIPSKLLWTSLNPKIEDEILRFYEITPFYICELAGWHMCRRQQRLRDNILKIASGDVLDYGGGIGDSSARLAEKGLNVTYADVRGRTFEFAEWLFKKRGLNIETVNLIEKNISKKYDTIICLDVVEHVFEPEAALASITGHLKETGKLALTLGSTDDDNSHPMHMSIKFNLEQLLRSAGLVKTDEEWLWLKVTSTQGKAFSKEVHQR
jgi:SAM-dependent methyltransferase